MCSTDVGDVCGRCGTSYLDDSTDWCNDIGADLEAGAIASKHCPPILGRFCRVSFQTH